MSKSQQYDLPHVKPAPPKKAAYKPFQPGPNPALPDFIRHHSTPYNPATDRYDVPAFGRDIVVDKAHPPKAIYDMRAYWSKKHWAAIRDCPGGPRVPIHHRNEGRAALTFLTLFYETLIPPRPAACVNDK